MDPNEVVALAREAARRGLLQDALVLLSMIEDVASPRLWLMRADLHRELCQVEPALRALDHAEALGARDVARFRRALLLPPMMGDRHAIARDRDRMRGALDQLIAEPAHLEDPVRDLPWLDFYLAYHGLDDRPVREALVAALRRAAPSLTYTAPHVATAIPTGRIRLGFCSSHLRDHTIGRLNEGLLEGLSDRGFDILYLPVDSPEDAFSRRLQAVADETIVVGRDLVQAQRRIAAARLDVLHYPDIGMDPMSTWLAFARLAPVQTASWGHPQTSGLDTIDAFLASPGLVDRAGEAFWTERIVRLPDPMVDYRRPAAPEPVARTDFGLPDDRRVYLCPQNLFKLHPDFDDVIVDVLRGDPDGVVALLAPPRDAWVDVLRARLAPALGDDLARLLFVDRQPRDRYLALLAVADVMLDPFPFGGGNTSLEAFAMGTPIVTLRTDQLRGRITACWYDVMGLSDLIASDGADYVHKALTWARSPHVGCEVRSRIAARCDRLFERHDAVDAWADTLHELVAEHLSRAA